MQYPHIRRAYMRVSWRSRRREVLLSDRRFRRSTVLLGRGRTTRRTLPSRRYLKTIICDHAVAVMSRPPYGCSQRTAGTLRTHLASIQYTPAGSLSHQHETSPGSSPLVHSSPRVSDVMPISLRNLCRAATRRKYGGRSTVDQPIRMTGMN